MLYIAAKSVDFGLILTFTRKISLLLTVLKNVQRKIINFYWNKLFWKTQNTLETVLSINTEHTIFCQLEKVIETAVPECESFSFTPSNLIWKMWLHLWTVWFYNSQVGDKKTTLMSNRFMYTWKTSETFSWNGTCLYKCFCKQSSWLQCNKVSTESTKTSTYFLD